MTTHDPTHLGALETGYDQGYDEALLAVNRRLRDAGLNPDDLFGDGVESGANPYTRLRDDRTAYVQQQVTDAFGTITDEDGDDLFDGEIIDAILDAHADWLTNRTPLVYRQYAGIDLNLADTDDLRDKPMVDSILDAYVAFRDADLARRQHASDCALHSEPAGTARPCDCASNPGAKPEHPQVTEAQVDAALAAFHHTWAEASNPTNYDVTQREAMRDAIRAAGAPEMKPWPIADNTGDVNAALNVIAGAVVHAALTLGISYMPLSTRYGIAGRVVDEIRSGR